MRKGFVLRLLTVAVLPAAQAGALGAIGQVQTCSLSLLLLPSKTTHHLQGLLLGKLCPTLLFRKRENNHA